MMHCKLVGVEEPDFSV